MSTPIEPATWYAVTVRDDNEACENHGQEFEVNPCYSNAGTLTIQCGRCRQPMTIVSAVVLNPQPEMT
ncbi:hypothetical protein ACFY30_22305 [Streptomyces sp. NPDC000345]|uniref:hypothetical protein n=1 Tax=Streptomyces sp. NPDC000345 TaxID=3364537 RepID=UPI00368438DD